MDGERWTYINDPKVADDMSAARARLAEADPENGFLEQTRVELRQFCYLAGSPFEARFFGNPPVGTPVGAAHVFKNYVEGVRRANEQQGRLNFTSAEMLFST